jgi:hypothetical protein
MVESNRRGEMKELKKELSKLIRLAKHLRELSQESDTHDYESTEEAFDTAIFKFFANGTADKILEELGLDE